MGSMMSNMSSGSGESSGALRRGGIVDVGEGGESTGTARMYYREQRGRVGEFRHERRDEIRHVKTAPLSTQLCPTIL